MVRWWISSLQIAELFVSSIVHLSYGTALARELLQALADWTFRPNLSGRLKRVDSGKKSTRVDDLPPIMLVHGIFGFGKGRLGSLSYFGGAEKKDVREDSKACGHSQFGGIYEKGYYPEWDEDHPIHYVGHSAGAQVVRVLQQMLAGKAFDGYENTSPNWMSQWRYPPDVDPPYKGYRYYKIVEGDHILFIINRERAGVQFDLIYDSIFERCRKHAFRKKPTLPNQVHQ
ncbi:alpha/beta-Hydrolases superfamily protein [Striga asiatica]|uniref:Alpha/beta-Hydrolases superfamily protein n=1 Tax=Striga asiatica TaxID=4170 RepID=A0A5A7R4A7_STRAF|nr:alpha/beta-Hydrolases superfamily protein [Striga asiatica]